MRNFPSGRAQSTDCSERVEHFLQSQIMPAQNVAFSLASMLSSQQVSCGTIFDGYKIQARIHVSRHASIEEVDDDLSRGRRFPVAGTYRGGGVDNHDIGRAHV